MSLLRFDFLSFFWPLHFFLVADCSGALYWPGYGALLVADDVGNVIWRVSPAG